MGKVVLADLFEKKMSVLDLSSEHLLVTRTQHSGKKLCDSLSKKLNCTDA